MLQQEHFEQYAAMHQDEDVTRYTVRAKLDRMETWRHLATVVGHWHLRGFGMWGVFEKATGLLVGRVGFHEPDGWPEMELAWTIGKAWWGRGYAPEAARRCLEYAFDEMRRDHVISVIDPNNTASVRVAEKLGYTIDRPWSYMGFDVVIYGIDAPRRAAGSQS